MDWKDQVDAHLETAHIILLLISADFLASEYCYSMEMKRALVRHEVKSTRVIPILIRPVDWQEAPFAKLQILPKKIDDLKYFAVVEMEALEEERFVSEGDIVRGPLWITELLEAGVYGAVEQESGLGDGIDSIPRNLNVEGFGDPPYFREPLYFKP